MADVDDDFKKVPEEPKASPRGPLIQGKIAGKLNALEQEAVNYDKAYNKLVCVMWVSSLFITC